MLSIRDLSALRDAQKQVELLSSIVASSRDAVIALDSERRIIVWNDAATSLYGYLDTELKSVVSISARQRTSAYCRKTSAARSCI
ncbi:MAG TPA: PAS domain-containing protein [Polyangiales bacterium]|nr:PAS domain-containing protein [Polyangiales bacterium]